MMVHPTNAESSSDASLGVLSGLVLIRRIGCRYAQFTETMECCRPVATTVCLSAPPGSTSPRSPVRRYLSSLYSPHTAHARQRARHFGANALCRALEQQHHSAASIRINSNSSRQGTRAVRRRVINARVALRYPPPVCRRTPRVITVQAVGAGVIRNDAVPHHQQACAPESLFTNRVQPATMRHRPTPVRGLLAHAPASTRSNQRSDDLLIVSGTEHVIRSLVSPAIRSSRR